jgi:hypothetical protein
MKKLLIFSLLLLYANFMAIGNQKQSIPKNRWQGSKDKYHELRFLSMGQYHEIINRVHACVDQFINKGIETDFLELDSMSYPDKRDNRILDFFNVWSNGRDECAILSDAERVLAYDLLLQFHVRKIIPTRIN